MMIGSYLAAQQRARIAQVLLAAALLTTFALGAWAETAEISLPVGGSTVMDFQNIKRVAVSDPAVADYVVLSAKQIMLTGKASGATDFYLWDSAGQHRSRVVVSATPRLEQTVPMIAAAIGRPEVQVSAHNGVILLEGEVDTQTEAERAGAIATAYAPKVSNLVRARSQGGGPVLDVAAIQAAVGPSIEVKNLGDRVLLLTGTATAQQKELLDRVVAGLGSQVAVVDAVVAPAYEPRQILARVKVIECNRTALSEIGVTWGGLTAEGDPVPQPFVFGEAFSGPVGILEGGPILRLEGLSALLKLLVTDNQARILAEPNLLVTEGKRAEILIGGEIPIPVAQTTTVVGSAGAITVDWKEFGVKLAIEGLVSQDGQSLDLAVSPEVSDLDYANGVRLYGTLVPAIRTRRANTVLHLGNCQTLVIGGLYQCDWVKSESGIPLLKDLPILGPFFSRTDKQQRDTELLILVTPEILTSSAAAARTEETLKKSGAAQQ